MSKKMAVIIVGILTCVGLATGYIIARDNKTKRKKIAELPMQAQTDHTQQHRTSLLFHINHFFDLESAWRFIKSNVNTPNNYEFYQKSSTSGLMALQSCQKALSAGEFLTRDTTLSPETENQLRAWKIVAARFLIDKVTDWQSDKDVQALKKGWDALVPDFEVDAPDGKSKVKKTFEQLSIDDKIDRQYVVPLPDGWRSPS